MKSNYYDPATYDALPVNLKQAVQEWIKFVIQPAKTKEVSAYYLKHCFEYSIPDTTNSYMTEGEFKGAMLAAGHEPVDSQAQSWIFRVKSKSPYRSYSKKHKYWHGCYHDNFCTCHCSQQDIDRYRALMMTLKRYG